MAKLGNVKVRTLRDIAYETISEAIMKHELMPGETLTITSLANKLGISPTPVREAVVLLSNEGILDYEANKRVRVSQIQREDVCEVYEARRLLEGHIARKLAVAVGEKSVLIETLEALKAEIYHLMETKQGAEQYTIIDLKLHELFLEMVENSVIKELFYMVGNKSLRIRTFLEASNLEKGVSEEALQPSAQEHLEIVEALLSVDVDRAVAAVDLHLKNSEERTLNSMDEYFKTL